MVDNLVTALISVSFVFVVAGGWEHYLATKSQFALWQTLAMDAAIAYCYFLFFEAVFARTPGKWLCGTRAVDLEGKPPGVRATAIRSLARLIPFEGLSFFGKEPNGWHDRLSKTRVISLSKLRDYRAGKIAVADPQSSATVEPAISEAKQAILEMHEQARQRGL